MKKIVKRACAGMFAVMMAVSAMSVPSSAKSISGEVGLGIAAGGSNSINSTGASATTYADSSITLNVNLYYYYENKATQKIEHTGSSDGNSPVTRVTATCKKPTGNYRSYYCYSSHNATYFFLGNSYHWGGTTKNEYYYE
mgnify:CR=1 FL=1